MENVANYLTKGVQVYIEGRLQTRNYEDKDGKKVYFTEVIGDTVILLGGRGADVAAATEEGAPARPVSSPRGPQRVPSAAPAPAPAPAPEEGPGDIVSDDDLPF
jgi:single-strand DNA-binding protein